MRRAAIATIVALVAAIHADARPSTREDVDAPHAAMRSVRDCDVGYRVHRPSQADARDAPAIVIAHGFMRNGTFMRGWAEAIAASGMIAVSVDLCASNLPGGRHADNGVDLVALRRMLGLPDVVYLGVSAGGLAALIAAAQDRAATRGVLLLDPVNAGGQARSAASRIDAPVAALVARPQVCNAWRNIDGALETLRDATIVPMGRASHCDFEWPSDRFCRVACIAWRTDPPADAQARIRRIGLAFLEAIASGDAAALARWKAGLAPAAGVVSPAEDDPAREAPDPPAR